MRTREPRLGKHRGRWVIIYWDERGHRRRQAQGEASETEARLALEGFKAEIEARKSRREGPLSAEQVYDRWLDSIAEKPMHRTARGHRRRLLEHFGRTPAEHISEEQCRDYAEARAAEGVKPSTCASELRSLKIALNWAAKRRLITHSPVIPKPPEGRPTRVYITKAEAARLLDAIETPHVKLFVLLALTTAARSGALFDLTWDRVDFDAGLIHLDDPTRTRTRKGRATVPIADSVRGLLLEMWQARRTSHVIEYHSQRITRTMFWSVRRSADRAGIPGVSPHVFRRSAARWMAEDGVSMETIAQFLGHEDVEMTRSTYARFSPDYLRHASRSLELPMLGGTDVPRSAENVADLGQMRQRKGRKR